MTSWDDLMLTPPPSLQIQTTTITHHQDLSYIIKEHAPASKKLLYPPQKEDTTKHYIEQEANKDLCY
jgi:hypothetical protein